MRRAFSTIAGRIARRSLAKCHNLLEIPMRHTGGRRVRQLRFQYSGTEIARMRSPWRRSKPVANEAFATAMVPNMSKSSRDSIKNWRMVMTNKTGAALAPSKGFRGMMDFDPFRQLQERFFEGFDPIKAFGGE